MNPLYEMFNGKQSGDVQSMMSQLQSHPVEMLKNAGYTVPQEMSGNPQAMAMHLIQTGQVGSPAMRQIQPMLNMLMGRGNK